MGLTIHDSIFLALVDYDTEGEEGKDSIRSDSEAPLSPDSFLEIYDRHYGQILNYLYRLTNDREAAEDLTSKTFMNVLMKVQEGKRPKNVLPYLYRIATNSLYSHWRKQKTVLQSLEEAWSFLRPQQRDLLSTLDEEQVLAKVRSAMETLPLRNKTALVLRFDEELSFRDLGIAMNLTEGSARSLVHRSLKMLRQKLAKGESL